ncbi:hypothetical protein G6O67_007846 [Ophiocordyceps sinensis]|uniref:Heat-labile enterotoxin, A chain n=1 Tax=Ophiocordyceps sinensis TaxID=72228 RepID=A0A8H4LVI3_9HYPO|nr:hypothetical protein G6O67_007846 [Ophiocordyceps sinensis]
MLGLKHAFVFGLVAISISAASQTNKPYAISKRALPILTGADRIPEEITLGQHKWTRDQISRTIKSKVIRRAPFGNKGLHLRAGKWVSKAGPLFDGYSGSLFEVDLAKGIHRGSYRAIVTNNDNLVGITEHHEGNNVRSIYDVNERIKSGAYLNDGSIPETILVERQVFHRKDIANVIYGQARGDKYKNVVGDVSLFPEAGPIDKLWMEPAVNGRVSDNVRVVYKGNNFVGLVDVSDVKNPRKIYTAPKSEVKSGGGSPGGSRGGSPGGSPVGPTSSGPLCRRDGASCWTAKEAATAKRVSENEFAKLVARNKHTAKLTVEAQKWSKPLSLSELRTLLPGYQPFSPNTPKLRLGHGLAASPKSGQVLGGALWISGVVRAFATDVSLADRLTAVSAILPFVGCAVQTAADAVERGQMDGLDGVLCLLGDALMLGGATAPFGFAVHVARAIVQLFKPPPELPTKEEMQTARNKHWQDFLENRLYSFLYSHRIHHPKQEFANKLSSCLAMEALAVLSQGAQAIGALNASSQYANPDNASQLLSGTREAIDGIRATTLADISRRQRQFLINITSVLKDDAAFSLKSAADEYNSQAINALRDNIKNYKSFWQRITTQPGDVISPAGPDTYEDVRTHIGKIEDFLLQQPPPMPSLFDIAYIIGQSKGLADVDPSTLSPQAYLRELHPRQPNNYITVVSIVHTQGIARLLRGNLSEADLPKIFPTRKHLRAFQLLVAIKHGKVAEGLKKKLADRVLVSGAFLDAQEVRAMTHPLIPPVKAPIDSPRAIAVVLGLEETAVATTLRQIKEGTVRLTDGPPGERS